MTLHNEERRSWLQPWKPSPEALEAPVCSMALPPAASRGWAGPRIRMQLPSFSGATGECPQLLQYTCQLCTNVCAMPASLVEVSPCSWSICAKASSAIPPLQHVPASQLHAHAMLNTDACA